MTIRRRRSHRRPLVTTLLAILCLGLAACSTESRPPPTRTTPVTSPLPGRGTFSETTAAPVTPVAPNPAPSQPRFLAAVELAWLDGVSRAAAIRLPVDGVLRWQGVRPGEQAELGANGSYRWVGQNGSMVGCAAPFGRPVGGVRPQRCLGIDSSGDVALTAAPHGPRVVYDPGGHLIGEFQPGGAKVPDPAAQPALAQAISASGVDLAALVDFATRRRPFAGGVTGDPHLITARGVRVSTQRAGDHQARSDDPEHQIQIRTAAMPFQTDVSYVTAAVVGVPGHRIELSLTGTLTIDGTVVAGESSDQKFRQVAIPDGPEVGLWPADSDGVISAVVLWPDGSTVALSADSSLGMTVIAHLPAGPAGGLFGVASADTGSVVTSSATPPNIPDAQTTRLVGGDFSGRSQTSPSGTVDQVVDSWQVPAGKSLFSGNAGPAVQPPGPPAQVSSVAALAAEKACATANMVNTDDMTACVYDVARTGDDGYVRDHVELAAAAAQTAPAASLAAQWPALELGPVSSPETSAVGTEIEKRVPAGGRRLYRLTLDPAATLSVDAGSCPTRGTGDEAARGAAALRFFDRDGHPVSARRANCGRGSTDHLPAGIYYLLLAGPLTGADASFHLHLGIN